MPLVLFETPAGYALFKVDKSKIASAEDVQAAFADEKSAAKTYVMPSQPNLHTY